MVAQAATRLKSTEGFLSQLEDDTFKLLQGLGTQRAEQGTFDQQLEQLETNLGEAMAIKEQQTKEIRMRVVNAKAEELRAAVAQEERDLAQAVLGLRELMNQIGLEYTSLSEPSEQEKTMVASAEARIKAAEAALAVAKQSFVLWRGKKVASAQAELQSALAALEPAKQKAQMMARKRLMSANLEGSLQHFQTQVLRAVDIMRQRLLENETQLQSVSKRRTQALTAKEQAAAKLEELDARLNDAEQQLRAAEAELGNLANGTAEYVAQETKVTGMRNGVEEVRGQRNTAFAIYQSKERFAQELQVHETAQRKLRDNQKIWIAVLQSDTQERLVTFRSRLEAMKSMADQEAARGLDRIGTEIDGRNVEFMATVGSASDRVRMDMVESHPERLRRIAEAAGAQAESIAKVREREAAAVAEFKRRYGINPQVDSFFAYGGNGQPASA